MSPIIVSYAKRNFEPAPEGLHRAVCVDVVDLGVQPTDWGEKHKVSIRWLIEEKDMSGKQYMVSSRYTLSLDKKANLRKVLETWRGRKFTAEELAGFDLEKLIGANCQLQVSHSDPSEDGTVYANVQAVVPAVQGLPYLDVPRDYVRAKDRENNPRRMGDDSTPF
jgi:hypothetical protein